MNSIVQAVLENASRMPEKIAIAIEDKVLKYSELAEKISIFANSLKTKGVKKGSRIAIEADALIPFFEAYLGCHLAGMIAVPIEKSISIYRLQEILKTTKPELVFMKNHGESFEEFLNGDLPETKVKYPKTSAVASIISTTGTTGNPVLVAHTNRSLVAESENLVDGVNLTEDSVIFSNISVDLAAGYRRVFAALRLGATVIVSEEPLNDALMKRNFERYPITHISTINSNMGYFVNINDEELIKAICGIRVLETVSGAISSSQISTFHRLYPGVTLLNVYGTTETGCLLYNNTLENFNDTCLGKPVCNVEIKIIDENGEQVVEPGKYGYIAVKGPMNMYGYHRKKTLTEQVMVGDYIIMNDIGYFDECGYYYFVSRVGDIIDVDGRKVIPTEIEKVALDYDGVADCACRAEENEYHGNVPKLYIVCDEDAFDFEKFKNYLKMHLESYKVPETIVPTDKIPRTSTGKVMRKMLK